MTPRMFYDAFEHALATEEKAEVVREKNTLRLVLRGWHACPITYLAYKRGHGAYATEDYRSAALAMGMYIQHADLLAEAADSVPTNSPRTRRALSARLKAYERRQRKE